MEATKRKKFWLLWIASAILLSLPALATSVYVLHAKTRAELSAENGQFSVEPSTFYLGKHVENYDPFWGTAPDSPVAPKGGYLNPGIGSSVPGQNFAHGWIKHDLYNQLNGLVGKADMGKFLAALKKGIVGPTGESGIKIFSSPVGKYTHELKIGGSAQRLLGFIDENGVLIFDKFVRGGLH